MNNRSQTQGCAGIFLLVIIFGFFALDVYYIEPKQEAKVKRALELKWSEQTIKYFSTYGCNQFHQSNMDHRIDKFFVISSHLDLPCEITEFTNTEDIFINSARLETRFTTKLEDANTIIWIRAIPGPIEARYSDGSNAVRLVSEINFIDKQTKGIYKTKKIKYSGLPKSTISWKTRSGKKPEIRDSYFGIMPYEEILDVIEREVFNM
jgi:hypothetical protein